MNDPNITNRELSEQIGDLRKDVDRRFELLETKLDGKFAVMDEQFRSADKRFDSVDKLTGMFKWAGGILVAVVCALQAFESYKINRLEDLILENRDAIALNHASIIHSECKCGK